MDLTPALTKEHLETICLEQALFAYNYLVDLLSLADYHRIYHVVKPYGYHLHTMDKDLKLRIPYHSGKSNRELLSHVLDQTQLIRPLL